MAKPKTKQCPSCGRDVSSRAYECPSCGHPLRKPRRGFFGILFLVAFLGFNAIMLATMLLYLGDIGQQTQSYTTDAERAGAAIGGTLGVGLLLTIWALGAVIFGLPTLLTRPRR